MNAGGVDSYDNDEGSTLERGCSSLQNTSEDVYGCDSGEGWLHEVELCGASLRSPPRTLNSSPTQAKFNPDDLKLRFLWTDFPISATLAHWD
jgi:hypothetical protein